MKYWIFSFALLFSSASGLQSAPITEIQWQGHSYQLVFVDLGKQTLSLHWKNSQGEPIRNLGAMEKLIEADSPGSFRFATNAGMYSPARSPVGLHIAQGKALVPLDQKKAKTGNFYLKPNGVFYLHKNGQAGVVETAQFAKLFPPKKYSEIEIATQSGPLLVIDGEIHPAFNKDSNSVYTRSGVGILGGGDSVVFAISNHRINLYSFASLFRDLLNCQNALFLDGAISRFHSPDQGLVDPGGSFGGILTVSEEVR